MFRFTTLVAAIAVAFTAAFTPMTSAASAADAAAVKQANATCKAQVKEEAQYNEMSLWARHKAVKKCIEEALAHH